MMMFVKRVLSRLFGWFGTPPAPADPYVRVREPRRRGPSGRSTAVAVAEPDE